MDEFTSHRGYFDEALESLEKGLIRCKEVNLFLSSEK